MTGPKAPKGSGKRKRPKYFYIMKDKSYILAPRGVFWKDGKHYTFYMIVNLADW